MNLEHLRLFKRVVELGSFVSAARDLRVSTTTVSERLAALEREMGTVLLNRTTRSLSLTDAGQTLLDGLVGLLEDADGLIAKIRLGADALAGRIRVSSPSDLGRSVVSGIVEDFVTSHPNVFVELLLSDGYIDIVGEGIDIALRFGTISDGTLRTRMIGSSQRIVCAAPSYLATHGRPQKPRDLEDHACLLMRFGQLLDSQWHFGEGNTAQTIPVQGPLVSNDGHLVRKWCLEGRGIALKSSLDVGADVKAGRLVSLLDAYAAPPTPLQMLFPPSRAQPLRTKAFADALATGLESAAIDHP